MEEDPPSPLPQAPPASKEKKMPAKRGTPNPQTPLSSRRTRSQAAPDWTVQEMLVLVGQIAAVDEDWLKALSSYQKWKMIADNCMAFGVHRSLNHCKRKWETLLADYRRIREWESHSGADSFWCLDGERRRRCDLPAFFEREVFSAMYTVIQAQEGQVSGDADSDSEEIIAPSQVGIPDAGDDVDPGPEGAHYYTEEDITKAREMANKLQESVQQVHAILRGELVDNADRSHAIVDLTKPDAIEVEFARQQADELIQAFGCLASTLHHFTELIKDGESKENRHTKSQLQLP